MEDHTAWKLPPLEYPRSLAIFSVLYHPSKRYQPSRMPLAYSIDELLNPVQPTIIASEPAYIPPPIVPEKPVVDKQPDEIPTPVEVRRPLSEEPELVETNETRTPVSRPLPPDFNWLPVLAGVGLLIAFLLGGIFWNSTKDNSSDNVSLESVSDEPLLKTKEEIRKEAELEAKRLAKIRELEQLEAKTAAEKKRLSDLKAENERIALEKQKEETQQALLRAKKLEKERQQALLRAQALEEKNRQARLKEEQLREEKRQAELLAQRQREEEAERNRCVSGRLSAEKIKRLVSGKTAYGVKIAKSGKNLHTWKEYQGNDGTAYFKKPGKSYSTGKWKVEERSFGDDVICWCYGECKEYACKYVESNNNCSSWSYIDSTEGNITGKVNSWVSGDETN